jgi:nucleotide-binding universal stress UspA family protein
MNNKSPFNSVLVPTDFSPASRKAVQWALRSVDGNNSVIIVLHVLDEAIIETITAHEFGGRDEVTSRMREHAQQQLSEYEHADDANEDVAIDTIIAEGMPFLEILQKARDFAVDAIVMGQVGTRGHVEKLLFGSTVDKVLRGARRPVIVLPDADHD